MSRRHPAYFIFILICNAGQPPSPRPRPMQSRRKRAHIRGQASGICQGHRAGLHPGWPYAWVREATLCCHQPSALAVFLVRHSSTSLCSSAPSKPALSRRLQPQRDRVEMLIGRLNRSCHSPPLDYWTGVRHRNEGIARNKTANGRRPGVSLSHTPTNHLASEGRTMKRRY
ncbi:hypothetical protein LZ31DRAFT_83005 [Colletotrichum somersetense]|nr:hypothetical protein LZ31DRAFT_83005 [Colletotrichum somersetense]